MQIEIRTTKKKLTKSLVNQMTALIDLEKFMDDEEYNVLGYMVNVRKGMPKCALLEKKGQYYVMPITWTNQGNYLYMYRHKRRHQINFESAEACTSFWNQYKDLLCHWEQIYI